ncbi:MAG: methyltransferase protein [Nevskia sp.]|nr:methyltransferase protein [Nevskia sp.]
MSEIELHRKLLGDAARNRGLYAALEQAIRQIGPGCRVIDVGAGTGFLSFLARRLGAAHCTLIEYTDTIQLAQELAQRNHIDGLDFIQAHSADVRGLPKADLVISETLGNFALEENLLESLVDARRFLKPRGLMIPAGLQQFVAPVGTPRLQRDIDIWRDIGYQLDLDAARTVSLNNMYVKSIAVSELAGAAQCWDTLEFSLGGAAPDSRRSAKLRWPADALSAPIIHGFALWWEVEWQPGHRLSTAPDAPATHWQQIYLPLLAPIELAAGDTLELQLKSDTRPSVGVRLSWQTARLRGGKRSTVQALDSLRGRL